MQHSLYAPPISPHLPAWCSTWMSWFKQTWIFARTIFKLFCKLSVTQVYERSIYTWCIKYSLLKTSPGSFVRFNALASLENLKRIIAAHLSGVFLEYQFLPKLNLHENSLPQAKRSEGEEDEGLKIRNYLFKMYEDLQGQIDIFIYPQLYRLLIFWNTLLKSSVQ